MSSSQQLPPDNTVYFPKNPRRQVGEVAVGVLLFVSGCYIFGISFSFGPRPSVPLFCTGVGLVITSITLFNVAWARGQGPMPWSIALNTRGGLFLALAILIRGCWQSIFRRS